MTLTPDYTIADNGLPSILNRQHKQTNYKCDRPNNNSGSTNPEPHRCWNADQSKKLLPKRETINTQQQQQQRTTRCVINTTNAPTNVFFNYDRHPSYAESDRNRQMRTTTNSVVWKNQQTESHRNNLRGVDHRGFSNMNVGARGGLDKAEKERLNHMRRNQC